MLTQCAELHSAGRQALCLAAACAALAAAVVPPSAARSWKLPAAVEGEPCRGGESHLEPRLLQPPAWHAGGDKAVCGRAAVESWEGQEMVSVRLGVGRSGWW